MDNEQKAKNDESIRAFKAARAKLEETVAKMPEVWTKADVKEMPTYPVSEAELAKAWPASNAYDRQLAAAGVQPQPRTIGHGDVEYQAASDRTAAEKAGKVAVTRGCLAYFPRALMAVAEVSMYGAKKHGYVLEDKGFLDPKYSEAMYFDAIGRHLLALASDGEINAHDGGLLHRAQLAWDCLAYLEKYLISLEKADGQARP